jgi:hypothetical protein
VTNASTTSSIATGATTTAATASCAAGKILLGGGATSSSIAGTSVLRTSSPNGNAWTATATVFGLAGNSSTDVTVTAFVICGN